MSSEHLMVMLHVHGDWWPWSNTWCDALHRLWSTKSWVQNVVKINARLIHILLVLGNLNCYCAFIVCAMEWITKLFLYIDLTTQTFLMYRISNTLSSLCQCECNEQSIRTCTTTSRCRCRKSPPLLPPFLNFHAKLYSIFRLCKSCAFVTISEFGRLPFSA